MWVLAASVGRYLVKAVSLPSTGFGLGCVLIRRQFRSLPGLSVLLVLEGVAPGSVVLGPAVTVAHDRIGEAGPA